MRAPARDPLFTARVAGQLAGLTMVAAMIAVAFVTPGESWLRPLRVLGSLVLGPGTLETSSVSPLCIGLFAHQTGPTYFWSRLFGLAVGYLRHPLRPGSSLGLGLAFGIVAEIVDVELLLPAAQKALNGTDLWRANVPGVWDWAVHLIFGASLGGFYFLLQSGRRRDG